MCAVVASTSLALVPQELQAFEVPQLMTLVDAVGDDNQICIAYKNQFDLINEKNGDTLQLYQIDANKVGHVMMCVTCYCLRILNKIGT